MRGKNWKRVLAMAAAAMLIAAGCQQETEGKSLPRQEQEPSRSSQQSQEESSRQQSDPEVPDGQEQQEVPSQPSSEGSADGEQTDLLAAQAEELLSLIEQGESTMEIAPELPFSNQNGTDHLERVDQWMTAVAAGEKDAFVGKLMGYTAPEIYTLEYDGACVTMTVYLPIPNQQPRQEQGVEIWQTPDFYLLRGTETILTIPRGPQASNQDEKEVSGEPALSSQEARERGMELYWRLQNPDVARGPYGIFLPKGDQQQQTAVVQQQEVVMVEDIPTWKLTVSDSQEGGNAIMLCLGGEQGEKAFVIEQVNGMLVPLGLEEEGTLLYQAD